jgi:hypothetical protein
MTDCQNDNNDKKARLLVLKDNLHFICQGLESDGRNFLAAIVHERLSFVFVFCDRIWIKQKAILKI